MNGCLFQMLSYAATSVLVFILCGPVFGVLYFFLPVILVLFIFITHPESAKLFFKKYGLWILGISVFLLFYGFMLWCRYDVERNREAMYLYYGSHSVELDLAACRNKLPEERYMDRSFYQNADDEMDGMDGEKIIGKLEYGMSPRDVYNLEDSLSVFQCKDITAGEFEPLRTYEGMFDSRKKLYGVKLRYYYAWGGREDKDAEVEADLKQVIENISRKYGEPTVNFRNDTAYHVKWNHENQVIQWYTEIDGNAYESELYIYLPWAYGNAFK